MGGYFINLHDINYPDCVRSCCRGVGVCGHLLQAFDQGNTILLFQGAKIYLHDGNSGKERGQHCSRTNLAIE